MLGGRADECLREKAERSQKHPTESNRFSASDAEAANIKVENAVKNFILRSSVSLQSD